MLTSVTGTAVSFTGCPAESYVHYMCSNDGDHPWNKEQDLIIMKHLFQDKHQDTKTKSQDRNFCVVMFFEAMCKRVQPNRCGQQDHKIFEGLIFN